MTTADFSVSRINNKKERTRKHRRFRRDAISLGLLWLPYSLLVNRFWYASDDAFIVFRYARNWVEGHGLRYNLGEHAPVEGYSDFLWVVFCAIFEYLQLDVAFWTLFSSFCCGIVLLGLLYRTLLYRLDLDWPVALFSVFTLACFPPFAVWSTSGLETMPFALALFVTFERMVLRREEPAPVSGGVAGLVLSLLRIEGVAWALFIGFVSFVSRRMAGQKYRRPLAIYSAIVVVGFSVFFVSRYFYYQVLFPNPVYVKVKFSLAVLLRGYRYVASYFLTFLTPFLLLPACLTALKKRWRGSGPAVTAVALAVPVYAIVVGGDWMTMGRFLVPGMAFQTILFALLVQVLWSWSKRSHVLVGAGVLVTVAVGLLPAWNIHLVGRQVLQRHNFMYGHPIFRTDYERWVNQSTNPKVSKDVGLAFRGYARPGDSLVVGMFGAIGYYSNLFIYDRYGLVNREVALLPHGDAPLRSPGHDFKVERSFFLKSEPTFITHLVIDGPRIREQAIDAANGWRKLWVWRTYFPDFIVVGNSSVADAERIVMVLRAVDEEPDNLVRKLPRPERRRVRAKRATTLWEDFYRRANYLPDH